MLINIKIILRIPEDPVVGTLYYLSFLVFFLKGVPGTKCCQNIFETFFSSKNKVFGPVQIPKKTFLNFFLGFFSTGTKSEKLVLFGFRIFEE
jgi:hypothetical protein